MNGEHTNAVAGPSSLRPGATAHPPQPASSLSSHPSPAPHSLSFPLLFLPPPAPPPPKQHLASTQDLLARFHLLPAYDKYVTPLIVPGGDSSLGEGAGAASTHTPGPGTPGAVDKGKGKELAGAAVATPAAADVDMADGQDGDDDDGVGGRGERKRKNSYKHLIKGVPGKHSFKKDDYLTTMMLVPPKQRMRIHRFDEKTQEDAFTVSLEGLKGWNINALVAESVQAREDRKKRKEAKRAAKLQAQTGQLPPGTPSAGTTSTPIAQPQPIQAPIPTSAASGSVRRTSTPQVGVRSVGTPKPGVGTPRPGVGTPRPSVGTPRPGSRAGNVAASAHVTGVAGIVVPRPTTVPRPGSTVPRPGSTVPRPGSMIPRPGTQAQGHPAPGQVKQQVRTPVIMRTGTPMDVSSDQQQRGKKRERDDIASTVNGVLHPAVNGGAHMTAGVTNAFTNGISNGAIQQKPAVMNAKAGTGNIRPRPIKKQRMDVQGQARDVTAPVQQQPTPQGV